MSITHRIAARYVRAADIIQIQEGLEALKALDANLDSIEEAFDQHFKTAGVLAPEVESQIATLTKSREGLKAALEIQKQAAQIIKLFPDDKAGVRAKADADKMVERFQKHELAAHKIIQTISKKTLPAALKKEAVIAEKLIRARLVDPEALTVIPWQRERNVFVAPTSSYGRGSNVQVIEYQVIFRLKGPEASSQGDKMLVENSGTAEPGVFGTLDFSKKAMTGKDFAEGFLKAYRGWSGIKGESEATASRAATAKAVASAIDAATRSMRSYDSESATISKDNLNIEGAYRSQLPKEGASDVGQNRYDEMVEAETMAFKKVLDPKLAPYKDQIAHIGINDGEKSWIYVHVTLK